MSKLEDHHKQLIQYFLHDGAYNQNELIDLLNSLRQRYDLKLKPKDEIRMFNENYLPLINKHIHPYGMEIKQVTSEEYENDIYYVCIQNFKAQFVKMDSSYTEKEAAIFEKLLELIITSDDKSVESRDVFEAILANDVKLTQKEFSETMTRFHRDKWIESGPNNTVILHARAINEMQTFIIDIYRDDVYKCQICTRLLIRGLNCSNSSCDIHMHRSCAARYFSAANKKNMYSCPSCKKQWNSDEVNEILKRTKTHDENESRLSNGIGNKKQRTSAAATTTTTTTTQNNRSIRSSNRRIVRESDEED